MTQKVYRRSWSQYNQYRNCPKSLQLARIQKAPQKPGVWLAAGTAVHLLIERYLRGQVSNGR